MYGAWNPFKYVQNIVKVHTIIKNWADSAELVTQNLPYSINSLNIQMP